MAAGGDAGCLVGKGKNAFQLVHGQGVQLLLAELGQGSPKEGIACAVGVAYLAGNASHMTGLVPKAVEYTVCTQGDKNQPDAVLCQLCRAAFAVGGAGEQGQLFIGHFQDIHQRQGSLHLGNGILFVLPVAEKQPNGEMRDIQTQSIAIGDGLNYEKPACNPVLTQKDLPEGFSKFDFRDPKIWREADGTYSAVTVCLAEDGSGAAALFQSKDGFDWHFVTVLERCNNQYGKMWECPDFFPLDGKQVLMLGPMEMLPKGEFHNGHNVVAFIGSYDEATHTFTKENVQLMDGGIDFYATQTTLAPDGRRIMTAWLQTWSDTEDKPQGCKWFGQTICPRELHIKDGRILQTPVRELDAVHGKRIFHENVTVQNETSLEGIKGRVADLTVTVQPGEYRSFTLKLATDADHHTSLTYDPYTSQLTLDRSYAGSRADIVHRRSCKVRSQNGALKLRILLDKNSIEVFANDGEQTMTAWIYTPQSADGITFAADGKATITAEQFELNL